MSLSRHNVSIGNLIRVVEKDALTCETIVYMLETMKYRAVGIETAKVAYDVLDAVRFDVLIIGLALDDPDGVNIAMDAKAYQRSVKVIVVSGRQPARDVESPR